MSFSLSRLRSTPRAMSIARSSHVRFYVKLRITKIIEFGVRNPAELHLDAAGAQIGVGEPALVVRAPVGSNAKRDAVGVRREYPSLYRPFARPLSPHGPAPGPAPVPRLGQRPVHAW